MNQGSKNMIADQKPVRLKVRQTKEEIKNKKRISETIKKFLNRKLYD